MPLTDDERQVFHELIAAATTVVTMNNIAGTTISEEFESMVKDPTANLAEVLAKCPPVPGFTWDGTFDPEGVDEELFTPDIPGIGPERNNTGVRLRFRHTGQSVEAYSSADVNENRRRAMRALKQRVERAARQFQNDPARDPLH